MACVFRIFILPYTNSIVPKTIYRFKTYHIIFLSWLCCCISNQYQLIKPWSIPQLFFHVEINVWGKCPIGWPNWWKNCKVPSFAYVAITVQKAKTSYTSSVTVSLVILKLYISNYAFFHIVEFHFPPGWFYLMFNFSPSLVYFFAVTVTFAFIFPYTFTSTHDPYFDVTLSLYSIFDLWLFIIFLPFLVPIPIFQSVLSSLSPFLSLALIYHLLLLLCLYIYITSYSACSYYVTLDWMFVISKIMVNKE